MIDIFVGLQIWVLVGLLLLFVIQAKWPQLIGGFVPIQCIAIAFFWPGFICYFCGCVMHNARREKKYAAAQQQPPSAAPGNVKLN